MDNTKQLTATKVIDAPAADIFALLSDPTRHSELDGSDMVRGVAQGNGPLTQVGQTFTMDMYQEQLGDYRMVNAVTAVEPDTRIGWAPSMDPSCAAAKNFEGVDVSGHTFTFDLRPAGGGTEVTETYDWSGVTDPEFVKLFPLVSEQDLAGNLDKIGRAVGR